ncbi:hypothetical protein [Halorarum salinum]|uniref:DUF8101 domain-containing protein n=1 Tax=Halorarum salinum TaxID=2743089 RepID=A0A7D5LBH2_9EURY|nr:hypothetical protein [Halobaculum salinum]QLG62752.1 hypothetical protein HUG12_13855 [Halobaculum salinum]
MTDERTDRPGDVDATLSGLLSTARGHASEGETDELLDALEAVATVARAELPETGRRERVLFGCSRVEYHAEADHEVAAEYLRVMERLFDSD